MAFAPHTNDMVTESNNLPYVLGGFNETEYGHFFEYAQNNTGLFPEFAHIVYITDLRIGGESGYRFANVKKTVAYILDSNEELQKWIIKGNRQYKLSA